MNRRELFGLLGAGALASTAICAPKSLATPKDNYQAAAEAIAETVRTEVDTLMDDIERYSIARLVSQLSSQFLKAQETRGHALASGVVRKCGDTVKLYPHHLVTFSESLTAAVKIMDADLLMREPAYRAIVIDPPVIAIAEAIERRAEGPALFVNAGLPMKGTGAIGRYVRYKKDVGMRIVLSYDPNALGNLLTFNVVFGATRL
jgi:hypothetical protein